MRKPTKYAAGTTVTPARSREELNRILEKYGATGFGYVGQVRAAAVMFEIGGRTYRYLINMPQLEDYKQPGRPLAQQKLAWEQATRERWRALIAAIKGKLIAVDNGIETFEEAFLRNTVMANGQTIAEYVEPQLEAMYKSGQAPRMLHAGDK